MNNDEMCMDRRKPVGALFDGFLGNDNLIALLSSTQDPLMGVEKGAIQRFMGRIGEILMVPVWVYKSR
ncbi:hypothetical protein HN51_022315, partial [Arachis hypogaea]